MRRLMWFAIGFTAACATGIYLIFGTWMLILGGVALVAFSVMYFLHTSISRQIACVLLGCIVGLAWLWGYDFLYLKPVRQMDGQTELLSIEVSDCSRESEFGITAEGKIKLDGKAYSIQFYINEEITLAPGDRVEGGFRLRYTGGGTEHPTFHRGKGIFLLGYPKGEHTIDFADTVPPDYFPSMLRQRILSLLDALFPEDTRSFAKALLLGETAGLEYQTKSALKTSGIYHIVSVSGMHVSILFAMICVLCVNRKWIIALIGLPVLFLFAAVAGFTPSIVRACIMQTLMILALLADKEYDPPTALAVAVLVLLIVNPISITSTGLQLSAGCIAGIFLFSKRIYNYFLHSAGISPVKEKSIKAKMIRWAAGSVSMTLGSMALTIPLSAVYFGSVSISGILTNLLTLWLVSAIFYGVVAACVLGALWLPLGSGIGWLISFFAGDRQNSKFHLNQALVLNLLSTILGILGQIGGFVALITSIISIVLLVFWIMGLVAACKGEEKPVPVIGGITILK